MNWAWSLIVLVALAGCTTQPAPQMETESVRSVVIASTECVGSSVFWMPSFSSAGPYLPAGYRAEDAGDFLGTEETGNAMFTIIFSECLDEGGEIRMTLNAWILVEPPEIEGIETHNGNHWYELGYYSSNASTVRELSALHVPAEPLNISLSLFEQAPNVRYKMWVVDNPAGEEILRVRQETAGIPLTIDEPTTVWHTNRAGTVTQDFKTPVEALFGGGTCFAGTQHFILEFMGNNCNAGGQTLTYTSYESSASEVTVQFHEGLRPR